MYGPLYLRHGIVGGVLKHHVVEAGQCLQIYKKKKKKKKRLPKHRNLFTHKTPQLIHFNTKHLNVFALTTLQLIHSLKPIGTSSYTNTVTYSLTKHAKSQETPQLAHTATYSLTVHAVLNMLNFNSHHGHNSHIASNHLQRVGMFGSHFLRKQIN